ncbi:ABC transporter substrate-binding protein [Paraburkholderia sp. BCC1886]|uniref:ABC transporter substrate-binding protein n=1 Tax=Paraburkholderia sp. BCC1886 TaxID=2562670 RepID=UPI001183CAF3|nr:ABC transporter substrate-binding protein [Paraburkholderia sp. BCC1886]
MPPLVRFIAIAATVCAMLLGAPLAHARKLTLMTGGVSKIIYLPVTLAARLGYFRDEGLDVDVLSEPAGVDTATELIAGAIQGAVGFYDHTIDLQSRGQDVQAIVVLGLSAGLAELASTRVAKPAHSMSDLQGGRLGVTGFGASTYFLSRYLAQQASLPDNAYTIVALGPDNGFADAMTKGSIDAGMIEEPTASRLLATGDARVIADMRTIEGARAALGGPYVGACLYAQRKWIDANPDATRRLVRAMVRALAFIGSHSASEIMAVLPPDFVGQNKPVYLQALTDTMPSFSRDGRMPEHAPQTVLGVLAAVDPSIVPRHVDLSRTYTNRFADAARAP